MIEFGWISNISSFQLAVFGFDLHHVVHFAPTLVFVVLKAALTLHGSGLC
jgi:hypothetical protein